jgi:hypothetical protein
LSPLPGIVPKLGRYQVDHQVRHGDGGAGRGIDAGQRNLRPPCRRPVDEPLIERDLLDQAAGELQRVAEPLTSHSINVTTFLFARGRLRATQGRTADALRGFLE